MPTPRFIRLGLAVAALLAALAAPEAHGASAPYVPGQVIVRYRPHTPAVARSATQRELHTHVVDTTGGSARVLRVPRGSTVAETIRALLRRPDVLSATPNYIARVASRGFDPDDRGLGGTRGWRRLQWNFIGHFGVGAPTAWSRVRTAGHPGARGVRIAVIDTGVAYRNWHNFRRSPDFRGTRFASPYDFIRGNRYPLDRNGHGTHVTGTIAEQTNNGVGVTGLAYGATIIPVRVLDAHGGGPVGTVARGIRYAVRAHAKIINISLDLPGLGRDDIPDVIAALHYARDNGVLVVAASGNGQNHPEAISYPARDPSTLSVGATTSHGCQAYYSNGGSTLDLVAPGGGEDANAPSDRHCQAYRPGRFIYQMTLPVDPCDSLPRSIRRFVIQSCWIGTSMAAPHVTGVAALVIASGVLGPHPSPAAISDRLERTARDLGRRGHDWRYGAGLVDATRATAPIR
jgi:serine protease